MGSQLQKSGVRSFIKAQLIALGARKKQSERRSFSEIGPSCEEKPSQGDGELHLNHCS